MIDGGKKIDRLDHVLTFVKSSSSRINSRSRTAAESVGKQTAERSRTLEALKERIDAALSRNPSMADPAEARKTIAREILLWEFGDAFRHHPDFSGAIDKIKDAIAGNRKLSRDVNELLAQLKE